MNGWGLLDSSQAAVARRVIAEESSRREHLVVYLSGAHAYGFPSPDSALDIKCIHLLPTRLLLGLAPLPPAAERAEVVDGVEVDYSSNEVAHVLLGILRGNGNFIERALGDATLHEGADLCPLRELVRGSLNRSLYRHYRGFAMRQLEELRRQPSAKRLLYVLRTTLTGTHVLLTGEVVTNLGTLLPRYGPAEAVELIARKRDGERVGIDAATCQRYEVEVTRLLHALDEARERSPLPEAPPNVPDLEVWLLAARRARM